MKLSKNNRIVVWRIIFTYIIMCFHFDNKYILSSPLGLRDGWYIGTEFFFIVSGFLIYAKIDEIAKKYPSGLDYTISCVKKKYPYYLGAFILSCLSYFVVTKATVADMIKLLGTHYFEALALQSIGLDEGWNCINNTGWYISTLFICGFILSHCLMKWRETFRDFVAPLIIIIGFSFMYRNVHGVGGVVETTGFYVNYALIHGMTGMCLGIFAARLCAYFMENEKNRKLYDVIGTLGFLFVIVFSMKWGYPSLDFLYTMILTGCVAVAFMPSNGKLCQSKFFHKWSDLTLCMYLVHDMFRTFLFPAIFGYPEGLQIRFLLMLLYCVVVTLTAIVFRKGVAFLLQLLFGEKDKKKGLLK